jgi:ABC-type multidrug transport system fused ATPase/permease subunit
VYGLRCTGYTICSKEEDLDERQQVYQQRCQQFAQQRDHYAQRWDRLANFRLVIFILGLIVFGVSLWLRSGLLLAAVIPFAVVFLIAVSYQYQIGLKRQHYATLYDINHEGLLRLARNWQELPLRQADQQNAVPAFSGDLDVLGPNSLQHLLSTPNSLVGRETLHQWLLRPATPAEIRQRQQVVAELAPQIEWRDEFARRGRQLGREQSNYVEFVEWAEQSNTIIDKTGLLLLSRVFSVITPIAVVLAFLNPAWIIAAVLCIVVTSAITMMNLAQLAPGLHLMSRSQETFRMYGALFAQIEALQAEHPALRTISEQLRANNGQAAQQMQRLGKIAAFADLRLSIIYLPLQLSILIDIHLSWLLERWRRDNGQSVREWLRLCGEVEALTALATLAYDQPSWIFPTIDEQSSSVIAEQLGHPLLHDSVRVCNDITVGPRGTLLLVTGSNMSGKSTLLRTVGLNVVLAQAGGPVCARAMSLPTVQLATSIRVQDSLSEGISYFMAELLRLKSVVDDAKLAQAEGKLVLYLLDEILHGTNTGERQIAARRIIKHLVDLGAIGMVSTHDLALADAPELQDVMQLIHFRELFERTADGPQMSFDYTLRPGVATSTNALKWLEIVGLGEEISKI